MEIRDFVVAFLCLFDVVNGAVLALSYGFFMFPSAVGYAVGAIGSLLTGAVTPVSFMYESMVLSWGQSKVFRERISMIILAALFTGLLGVLGLPQIIVDSIGKEIFLSMLAGVGLYLAKVGIEIANQQKIVGIPCLVLAIATQLLTNDLVLTVSISVAFGIIINFIICIKWPKLMKKNYIYKIPVYSSWVEMIKTEMKLVNLVFNRKVLVGTMVLSTLTIGGNIAYTAANSQISLSAPTYNQSTVISSLADFGSSLYGGANMELIISPTAAAPNPVQSGVLFMVLAVVILASGLVHRIAKWIPLAAIGGYLFVIGAILILPYNAIDAFKAGNEVVVGLTMAITLLSNPFYGIVVGSVAKLLMGF